MRTDMLCVGLAALVIGTTASAWDPNNGDWSKSDATDFRVMTWNVQDGICSTNNKQDLLNNWSAIVRTIAAMKPDVLILQECGDNSGNGTGGSGDSATTLATVMGLLIDGGTDPFLGGTVGSYLKLYDPALDYPTVFVSSDGDGFNRNVIISMHPLGDLNADASNQTRYSDIVVFADEYAPGIDGGIRGYQFCELDLPDEIYAGDVVIGNGHLKAGGSFSDGVQREEAAQDIAYWIDYFYNGAGTGIPDPNNVIPFNIPGTTILDANTPVIWGGDLNQNLGAASGNSKSPAEWTTQAVNSGGSDGTDRDGTDSEWDAASHPLTGDVSTQGSSSKLDFLCWQDSIVSTRRQVIFRSSNGWPAGTPYPPPIDTYTGNAGLISSRASDHRPVIIDFILPLAPPPECPGDLNGDNTVDTADLGTLIAQFGGPGSADLNDDGVVDTADLGILIGEFGNSCP